MLDATSLVESELKTETEEQEGSEQKETMESLQESSGNEAIDAAAEAFVDSDETLQEEEKKATKFELPHHSGYPYKDNNEDKD